MLEIMDLTVVNNYPAEDIVTSSANECESNS